MVVDIRDDEGKILEFKARKYWLNIEKLKLFDYLWDFTEHWKLFHRNTEQSLI